MTLGYVLSCDCNLNELAFSGNSLLSPNNVPACLSQDELGLTFYVPLHHCALVFVIELVIPLIGIVNMPQY